VGKIKPKGNFCDIAMLDLAENCFDRKKNGENPVNEVIEKLREYWKG